LGDSLQDAGAFDDDQQVWKITIERGAKIKGGGCEVTVTEYFHAA
jgi:Holliday junction resolvase RusA-like endonuclease